MAISQESKTRDADPKAALTANANLGPAIAWLRQHTPMSRLTDLEINEVIRDAVAGPFTLKYNGNAIP
jgi:hypothetical protein